MFLKSWRRWLNKEAGDEALVAGLVGVVAAVVGGEGGEGGVAGAVGKGQASGGSTVEGRFACVWMGVGVGAGVCRLERISREGNDNGRGGSRFGVPRPGVSHARQSNAPTPLPRCRGC